MKKIIYLFIITISSIAFYSCDDDKTYTENLNYITFETSSFDFPVDLGSTATNDIKIYSTQVTSSARTISVMVVADETTADPASYEVPASVTIPANSSEGVLTVNVSDINIGDGVALVLAFSESNGLFTGESITLNIKQVCPLNELFLNISFDSWPEEIYWVLEDDSANVVAESAPGAYGAYAGLTGGIEQTFCLPSGDYTFTIYDQYGDGAGPFSFNLDGNILFESNGAYGPGTVVNLTL